MRPIHNYPVVPEAGEHYRRCSTKPVTRAELKCDLRTAVFLYSPKDEIFLKALLEYGFSSSTYFYTQLWLRTPDGQEIPGGMENLRKLAEAGIYLFHVGMRGTAEEMAGDERLLIDQFGDRYLGAKADSELDGGYTRGWCWGDGPFAKKVGLLEEPSPGRSRAQAHREYDQVLNSFYDKERNLSICSLGYGCHYAAEHETRMLGVETVEKLPSDTVLWCFCRGASKQYDLLTSVSISSAVSRPWGCKGYYPDGRTMIHPGSRGTTISGADYGFSEGLSKREWYVSYMYGCSLVFFQGGYFYSSISEKEGPPLAAPYEAPLKAFREAERPDWALLEGVLTPLGKLHAEAQEVAYDHPVRGVPYMPVALMLDEDHGWNQPRHLYRKDEDHVWGNIPYSRLDYQIDNFFRWVYPGYEVCSFHRDERGYITNTPFGDLYEVLLSNASPGCLEKYRTVVLMGDLRVEGREGLAQRLTDFLKGGGIVVTGVDQWPGVPATLAGVEVGAGSKTWAGEVVGADGKRFREAAFDYREARATGGEVLLKTPEGDPLVVRQVVGEGRLYTVTVQGWGKAARRHDFLKGVRHVLGGLLGELNLVEVEGRDIYYLVNVTDRDDELIVTLCNNSPDAPWEGRVRIKGEEVESFEAWLGHSEACLRDGALLCAVPANDVRIFTLKAERGFLPLMFREIDWKGLGVGVPETDLRNHPGRRMGHF
ncbi:MAG: hypothetical protein EXS64_06815 [Candidatus Latescibacteria bacterium]|nr:hypothetical protein [Candidatus Latescibacterota bacterium]